MVRACLLLIVDVGLAICFTKNLMAFKKVGVLMGYPMEVLRLVFLSF